MAGSEFKTKSQGITLIESNHFKDRGILLFLKKTVLCQTPLSLQVNQKIQHWLLF